LLVPTHRHSRAHVRHHFIRVALARRRAYLDFLGTVPLYAEPLDLSLGRFANEQPYLGCHRPRCGVCQPDKRWHRDATASGGEREWRRDWADELPWPAESP
jgi:hypothetical protein